MSIRDVMKNWQNATKNGEEYDAETLAHMNEHPGEWSEETKEKVAEMYSDDASDAEKTDSDTSEETAFAESDVNRVLETEGPAGRLKAIQAEATEKGLLSLNGVDFTYVAPEDRASMRDGAMSKADSVNLGMSYAYDLQTFADTECTVASSPDVYGGFDIKDDELGKNTEAYKDLVKDMYESDVKSEYGFPMAAYEGVDYTESIQSNKENDDFVNDLAMSCPDGTDRVNSRMNAKHYMDRLSSDKNAVDNAVSFVDEKVAGGYLERRGLENAGKDAMDAMSADVDLLSETQQSDASKESYQQQWGEKMSALSEKFSHVMEEHGVSKGVMQSFETMSGVAKQLGITSNESEQQTAENKDGFDLDDAVSKASDFYDMAKEKFGNVLAQVGFQSEKDDNGLEM